MRESNIQESLVVVVSVGGIIATRTRDTVIVVTLSIFHCGRTNHLTSLHCRLRAPDPAGATDCSGRAGEPRLGSLTWPPP